MVARTGIADHGDPVPIYLLHQRIVHPQSDYGRNASMFKLGKEEITHRSRLLERVAHVEGVGLAVRRPALRNRQQCSAHLSPYRRRPRVLQHIGIEDDMIILLPDLGRHEDADSAATVHDLVALKLFDSQIKFRR